MSYFCKFCGKVLTTGDDIDRCNPDCSQKNIPVFEIEQISWDTLKYQNDQLKIENDWYKEKNLEWQKKYDTDTDQLSAENKKLKAALQKIKNFSLEECADYEMSDAAYSMRDVAEKVLEEVTK